MIRFIHIPKTGGAAVRQYLLDNNIAHKFGSKKKNGVYAKKHRHAKWWLEKYPTENKFFCVVRNPYNRLVSYYRYLQQHNALDKSVLWEEFVTSKIKFESHWPWELQIEYIYDSSFKKQLVQNVFRFENLERDVNSFFNLDIPMKMINVTNNSQKSYLEEYYSNKEIKNIVGEHFLKDFEFLNYSIE